MKRNKTFLIIAFMMLLMLSACSYLETQDNFEDSNEISNPVESFDNIENTEKSVETDENRFKPVEKVGKLKSVINTNEFVIIQDQITGCFYISYSYGNRMSFSPYYDETGTAVKGCYKNPNNEDLKK